MKVEFLQLFNFFSFKIFIKKKKSFQTIQKILDRESNLVPSSNIIIGGIYFFNYYFYYLGFSQGGALSIYCGYFKI